MTGRSRGHAPAFSVFQPRISKLDANGPIAPQIPALCRAFPAKKPLRGATAVPRPRRQPLFSRRNLLGCHDISSVKEGLGRPQKPVRLFITQ
jgi:hypothetical protein